MNPLHYVVIGIVILTTGCGLPYLGEADCASLGPSECDARDDCSFIFAAPFEDDRCLGDMQPVGCAESSSTCLGEPSAEADGLGNCWLFRDGCRPEGWPSVDPSFGTCPIDKIESAPSCSREEVDCASLRGDECRSEIACRPVFARLYDDANICVGMPQEVACEPRTAADCSGQSTSVMRRGDCWLFHQTCVPESWRPKIGDGLTGCGVPDVWQAPTCS